MPKHTQEPWHAEYFQHSTGWDVTHGPADDASERFSVIDDLTEANAKLMAAAPDMLAALKMVLQHGRIDDSESRMAMVASAITKAEQ
jgi:hypothetical protein